MMELRIGRMAYVTTMDAAHPGAWSGIAYQLWVHFQAAGIGVDRIGPLRSPWRPDLQACNLVSRFISGKRYLRSRNPGVLKGYARQVRDRIHALDVDLVFSPGSIPIAYLETELPLVFWTDATFQGMVDFYPDYSQLCQTSLDEGHRMEQAALERSALALYSSPWAAETARRHYQVDSNRVAVVPFGPSLALAPEENDLEGLIQARVNGLSARPPRFNLLFIGSDWHRKGGDKALAVASALLREGVDVALHVVGAELPASKPGVHGHGFISTRTQAGRERLAEMFRSATFLLLPTRADCLPVVLSEACSFGLPFLTTSVGGIPGLFKDGEEGHLFAPDAPPEAYADVICRYARRPDDFEALCRRAQARYERELNWPFAIRRALHLMEEVLG